MGGERPPEVVGNVTDLMTMMDEMREIHAGIINELEDFRSRDQIPAEELISIRDKQRRFDKSQQEMKKDVDGNHHILAQNLKENRNLLASRITKCLG